MVKGVHLYSREYEVIRLLSLPPLRDDSMNHTIRKFSLLFQNFCRCNSRLAVLDMVEVYNDQIAFIVMEEWSPQLIPGNGPCCLSLFLAALRQCIEVHFLHLCRETVRSHYLACCILAQTWHCSPWHFFTKSSHKLWRAICLYRLWTESEVWWNLQSPYVWPSRDGITAWMWTGGT